MSEKKQKPLDAEAVNTLVRESHLDSACRSLDEANRELEAEDPVLFRELEEHARALRERRKDGAIKARPPASAN